MYLFFGTVAIFSGFVFGLGAIEWAILVLSLGLVLSVELFHQLLVLLMKEFRHHLRKDIGQMMRLGTAAVVSTNVVAFVVIAILFSGRIAQIWNG